MLTGAQIRAARGALRWSVNELARYSGVAERTIARLEQHDGVPPSRSSSMVAIQEAFEARGIQFVGAPGDGPGIRIHTTSPAADDK